MIDLKFDSVSKLYRVREEDPAPSDASNPLLRKLQNMRRGTKEFWAVRDVSFDVARGEALGIIGHNGAGKSTMLKLIAGITAPTSGEITINGRLSALIEVGSGFHPDLTGRENVFLSGSILGMRRREIAAKLDSIVDFAGVRQFIDTPVKRYSSGMYVRLGFAIAAHLEPDILLLDEVLAVGDADFQSKCFRRITELREKGTTIVFISHDLSAVERLCSRALLMDHGQVIAGGIPSEVIKQYTHVANSRAVRHSGELRFDNTSPDVEAPFLVERVEALDFDGQVKSDLRTGDYVRFRVTWRSENVVENGGVELGVHTSHGVPLFQYATRPITTTNVKFRPGLNAIELEFEHFPLAAGDYRIVAGLTIPNVEWLYRSDHFATLSVGEGDYFCSGNPMTSATSILAVQHRWINQTDTVASENHEYEHLRYSREESQRHPQETLTRNI